MVIVLGRSMGQVLIQQQLGRGRGDCIRESKRQRIQAKRLSRCSQQPKPRHHPLLAITQHHFQILSTMSVPARIAVLNDTIEQLQQMVPDLFLKVALTLSTLSILGTSSNTQKTHLQHLADNLRSSLALFQAQNHQQLQNFMSSQVDSEERRGNQEQMEQYEEIFNVMRDTLHNKETILLEKRGMKPTKKMQSMAHGKYHKEIKQSNAEYGKFSNILTEVEDLLAKYQKELKAHTFKLQRRTQKLEWTCFRKPESYQKCINSEKDLLEIEAMPSVEIPTPSSSLANKKSRPGQDQVEVMQDLFQMLSDLKQQNQSLQSQLHQESSYTSFLAQEHSELAQQLGGAVAQKPKPIESSIMSKLQRKRFPNCETSSVQSF